MEICAVINLYLVHSHDWIWSEAESQLNPRKCHMINLGAPSGHVNKPKIQMRSIVFSGVLTV